MHDQRHLVRRVCSPIAGPGLAMPRCVRCAAAFARQHTLREMRHHQAQVLPAGVFDEFLLRGAGLGLDGLQHLGEFAIAPARHGQGESHGACVGRFSRQFDLAQLFQVVQRQQAAVGHHDQSPEVREAFHHLAQRGQQGGPLGLVAIEHLVVDRQAHGRLHHAQIELAGDNTFLGHATVTNVAWLLTQAGGTNGRQVVEHRLHVLFHQRPQQARHQNVHIGVVVHERIHAAQQLLVRQRRRVDLWCRGRVHTRFDRARRHRRRTARHRVPTQAAQQPMPESLCCAANRPAANPRQRQPRPIDPA